MVRDGVKERVKATPLYPALLQVREIRAELQWRARGRPAPAPARVKRRLLRAASRSNGLRVLVETGTFRGDTIAALLGDFDRLFTVELFDPLYQAAAKRFADEPKVTVLHGNSAERLPEIVAGLDEPALFWLDAHDSGPGTGRAEVDPPAAEVAAIFASPLPHVIYIDDARTFHGADGYPSLGELAALTAKHRQGWRCVAVDDVIRIEPAD